MYLRQLAQRVSQSGTAAQAVLRSSLSQRTWSSWSVLQRPSLLKTAVRSDRPGFRGLNRPVRRFASEGKVGSQAEAETAVAKAQEAAAEVYQPVSNPYQTDYVANQHFLTLTHKLVLVGTLTYWPHQLPKRASHAVLNGAYGRLRVIAATCTVFLMLAIAEEAMAAGRRARDGGEECLYNTSTARELQSAKRQWVKDFDTNDADQRAAILNKVHDEARGQA
eukprot:m.37305 g.37305  ORF g.37305 m.37305 type:complete len:221 (-) comp12491_c0_seq1:1194-1856(-)